MTLEVLTQNDQIIFLARIEEVTQRSVKLINASGGPVPQVFYNTGIKLRGFLSDMKTILLDGVVRGSSDRFWVIEELQGQVRSGRSFFRQQVSSKARVSCVNGIFAPDKKGKGEGKITPCEILDISGGGVRICSAEKYQVGDWLFIMDAKFAPVKEVFSFTCKVLHTELRRGKYIYGCQFEGLTQKEQDRLVEAIFILQREETQRKAGRRG